MKDVEVYLINLDRSPDRLDRASRHLFERKIPFTRVEAIDGKSLTGSEFDRDKFTKCMGFPPRNNDIGCFLSHLKVIDLFLKSSPSRYCLILEDDVEVFDDFRETLVDLVAHDAYGFDMVRLQGLRSGLGMKTANALNGRSLKVLATRVTGSTAYLINRHCAEMLLARLEPVVTYDHAFDKPLSLGIKIAHLLPYPAWPTGSPTTIGGIKKQKVRGIRKLMPLWWRTKTESERALAAIMLGKQWGRG